MQSQFTPHYTTKKIHTGKGLYKRNEYEFRSSTSLIVCQRHLTHNLRKRSGVCIPLPLLVHSIPESSHRSESKEFSECGKDLSLGFISGRKAPA